MTARTPPVMRIGINPTSIGVTASWWLEAVQRAEAVGFDSAWIWDHFVSRGQLTDPVLECWTMLAAASAATRRIGLCSFVSNVMNRHPAVLARVVATLAELSGGRVELGIGSGGHPAEHAAYGIYFPEPAVRAAHLEEAVAVLRLLLAGGPVDFRGRHYQLEAAHAFPVPQPAPRIVVAGMTPAGARLAARIGDAWTCPGEEHDRLGPVFRAALAAAGREEGEVSVVVSVPAEAAIADLDGLAEEWTARGVHELVIRTLRPPQLEPLMDAVAHSRIVGGGSTRGRPGSGT